MQCWQTNSEFDKITVQQRGVKMLAPHLGNKYSAAAWEGHKLERTLYPTVSVPVFCFDHKTQMLMYSQLNEE